MRKTIAGAVLVVVALAVTGLGARNEGDDAQPNRTCSDMTLRGAYGLQFEGLRPVRPPFPAGVESYMGIAVRTYDGHGQFTQISNVKGSVIGIEADVQSAGTYVVNEDCSGSHSAQFVPGVPLITDRFVIVSKAAEVRFAVMTPLPIMNSGVLKKIHSR